MRALRYHGPGDMRLEEMPDPEPGPGDVLVRSSFAGLCRTDLEVLEGELDEITAALQADERRRRLEAQAAA